MARKYKREFSVTMTAKVEDDTVTEAQLKRDLKEKAALVEDMKLEIGEVKQTFPAPAAPTPAPAAEQSTAASDSGAPEPPKEEQEAPSASDTSHTG